MAIQKGHTLAFFFSDENALVNIIVYNSFPDYLDSYWYFPGHPYICFFSFGFPPTITVVTTSVTHLQNQYYDVCIRRASSYCYICYMAQIVGTTATTQATQTSFGVR